MAASGSTTTGLASVLHDRSVLSQLVWSKSSREVWSALEHLFASSSKNCILQLKIQMQSTKKGSMSIYAYVAKMKSIADNLGAAGSIVTDKDLIMHSLTGIGSEYDCVVVNITSRPDVFTLQDVISMLVNQESCIEQLNPIAKWSYPMPLQMLFLLSLQILLHRKQNSLQISILTIQIDHIL